MDYELGKQTFFDYYEKYIKHTFVDQLSVPHFIIETDSNFPHLSNFVLDNTVVEYCNTHGVHFYLREIPYLCIKDMEFPNSAKTEFKDNWTQIKSTYVGFESEQQPRVCFELEAISEFVERNNLTNVHVFTGLYNFKIKKRYRNLNLQTKDYYVYQLCRQDQHNTPTSFNKDHFNYDSSLIDKKFICLNRRYEGYRELICDFLLDKDCYLSYAYKHIDFDIVFQDRWGEERSILESYYWNSINNRICFEVSQIQHQYQNRLVEDITLDYRRKKHKDFFDLQDGYAFDTVLPKQYYNSFCAVVTESKFFFPFGHFADKTLNAIKMCRPFVLVSSPNTLAYVKSLGFKTFDEFWDESYDTETDHLTRFNKVLKVLNYIDSMDISQLKKLYDEMKHILEHNFNHLSEIHNEN